MMKVKLLNRRANPPLKLPDSIAYDLFANETVTIQPRSRGIVAMGISVDFPSDYVGRLCDRSGVAWGKGLHVLAGVMDPKYRGEWKVVFYNTTDLPVTLEIDTRIVQVLFYKVADWEVEVTCDLSETERGEGGFGSTGDN